MINDPIIVGKVLLWASSVDDFQNFITKKEEISVEDREAFDRLNQLMQNNEVNLAAKRTKQFLDKMEDEQKEREESEKRAIMERNSFIQKTLEEEREKRTGKDSSPILHSGGLLGTTHLSKASKEDEGRLQKAEIDAEKSPDKTPKNIGLKNKGPEVGF